MGIFEPPGSKRYARLQARSTVPAPVNDFGSSAASFLDPPEGLGAPSAIVICQADIPKRYCSAHNYASLEESCQESHKQPANTL